VSDRKHYSKTREAALWRIVDRRITDLRLKMLRETWHTASKDFDNQLRDFFAALPDQVTAEYRRSMSAKDTEPKL
jgi:hypothetical protein